MLSTALHNFANVGSCVAVHRDTCRRDPRVRQIISHGRRNDRAARGGLLQRLAAICEPRNWLGVNPFLETHLEEDN